MGDFTITKELENAFQTKGITYYMVRLATPEEFYNAIGVAKISNPHGAFVTQHSLEEYKDMKYLFLTDDGTAGIAVTKDNNIVSIFNGGVRKGVLKTLLPLAIQSGGRKLDNYNSIKLSGMYEMYGFNPVSKTRFLSQFAPDDWNYERDGEPDVVFWIHNGDTAEDVILNFGRYQVPWDAVTEFATYDEACDYRDDLIKQIDSMENEVIN